MEETIHVVFEEANNSSVKVPIWNKEKSNRRKSKKHKIDYAQTENANSDKDQLANLHEVDSQLYLILPLRH